MTEWRVPIGATPLRWHEYSVSVQDLISAYPEKRHGAVRDTPKYQTLYKKRKETIERVFADAKEKHAMRYTQYRGLAQVTNWVKLKFAAMNLKKLPCGNGTTISVSLFSAFSALYTPETRSPHNAQPGFSTDCVKALRIFPESLDNFVMKRLPRRFLILSVGIW